MMLVAGLLFVAAAAQQQQSYQPVAYHYQTVKVAEGIFAFVAPEPRVGLVSGNATAIFGDDRVLVVDSGHFPTLTRRMVAEIRRMTDRPVRWLVNTHWHPDHHSGNFVYREAFPAVTIVSTGYAREQMVKRSAQFDTPEGLRKIAPLLEERLASGKKRDGTPLTDDDRRYYRDSLADIRDIIPELEQYKPVLPDLTFERRLSIHLGRRTIEVMFLGRGNTGGDAVVYVPDAKVLVAGDLLVAPTPYAAGSFFGEWIETLRKLQQMDSVAIVPGHGPVQRDQKYLKLVLQLLESTRDQAKAARQQGMTLEQTRAKVDLSPIRAQMAGDNPVRIRMFNDAFATPGIARAYREAKQGPLADED